MSYPVQTFTNIPAWENFLNTNIIANGNEEITGTIGNTAYNGAVTFIKKSPLNWGGALVINTSGAVNLTDNFFGVAVFSGSTPSSLSFGDNFYNQYVFINMTGAIIPLGMPSAYYDLSGNPVTSLPANAATILFKASNSLWVLGNSASGGGGSTQKEPKTYIVGATSGAPTAGANTWTNAAFANSWVIIVLGRSITIDLTDAGDGSPYISKVLASTTLTVNNYTFNNADILTATLITP